MIKTSGIHHLVLTVKDPRRSKDFYERVCGMKVIIEKDHYCALKNESFYLFLGIPRDHNIKNNNFDRNRVGLDHWAFHINSIKGLKKIEKELKKMNVAIESSGITDDGFGGKAIFTQDSDGMKVEFHLQN